METQEHNSTTAKSIILNFKKTDKGWQIEKLNWQELDRLQNHFPPKKQNS